MTVGRTMGRWARALGTGLLAAAVLVPVSGAATAAATPAGQDLPHPLSITAGRSFTCTLISDGSVWCFGENSNGNLGNGTTTKSSVPVRVERRTGPLTPPVPLTNAVAVAAGTAHACAIRQDTTVWCWGWNAFGSLGDGTEIQRNRAVQVRKENGDPLTNAVGIGLGAVSSCAVTSGGAGFCWGDTNTAGIGDGGGVARFRAVRIRKSDGSLLTGVAQVDAGAYHVCARTTGGAAWCMGANGSGAVGDGTSTNRTLFVRVEKAGGGFLTGVTAISAGNNLSCAVAAGGAAYCWGTGSATGTGTTKNVLRVATPVKTTTLAPLTEMVDARAGAGSACARGADGRVWCWGSNQGGRLLDGTTTDRNLAALAEKNGATPIAGAISMDVGEYHVCVTGEDLFDRCGGMNYNGQLGDGTTIDRRRAVPVLATWILG